MPRVAAVVAMGGVIIVVDGMGLLQGLNASITIMLMIPRVNRVHICRLKKVSL